MQFLSFIFSGCYVYKTISTIRSYKYRYHVIGPVTDCYLQCRSHFGVNVSLKIQTVRFIRFIVKIRFYYHSAFYNLLFINIFKDYINTESHVSCRSVSSFRITLTLLTADHKLGKRVQAVFEKFIHYFRPFVNDLNYCNQAYMSINKKLKCTNS